MNTDHSTPELWEAIAGAQAKLRNPSKDALNPHYKSSYATLAQCLDTVRPVFAQAGLGIVQCPTFNGESVTLETVISHKGGGWISSELSVIPGRTDAQGLGSVITYARRYALCSMAGISAADDDDDGSAAAHNTPPAPPPRQPSPRKPSSPTAAEMKTALRESYQAAGIKDGEVAEEIMRQRGFLSPGQHVPDLDAASLRKAYEARATIFADAGDAVLILDNPAAPGGVGQKSTASS